MLAILVTGKKKKKKKLIKFLSVCWFEKNQVVRFVGTYICIFTYGIHTHGEKTWANSQSRGAHLPPSLLIKRKGDSRPNSRAGKAKKTGTELNGGRLVYLREGLEWLNSRHLEMPHPHHGSGVVPCESEEVCTLWGHHGPLQAMGKEAGRKGSSAFGVSGHVWTCHAPLGLGQWGNHSGLSANAPLWSPRGKRNPNLKNPQVPEGFLGRLSITCRDVSHFRGQRAPTGRL